MKSTFTRGITKIVLLFVMLCLAASAMAQSIGNVNVDDLSDEQLQGYLLKAKSAGLTTDQILQAASEKGMKPDQIGKLKDRISKLDGSATGKTKSDATAAPRELNLPAQDAAGEHQLTPEQAAEQKLREKIFGSSLFSDANLTFEPNLRIATPKNYIIGPDDELDIDISGDNEASYKAVVTPEGIIRVEFVGNIPVNGLSIEQATAKIKTRLAQTYPAIRTGKTTVTVGIGNIRSIKVTLLGEVIKPGTYTLPSLATAFNALYASGGPTRNGSFREIELIRNGVVVSKLDIYNFLLKGYQSNNLRLQDQDVIRIPVYKVHAELLGNIKHPAVFELLPNETLGDMIKFAGGFTDEAYVAKIKVIEITDKDRKVSDISSAEFNTYRPKNGDKFVVDQILDRVQNRVNILGPVNRPGQFELKKGLTVLGLIKEADGIRGDAFLLRGQILRTLQDSTLQIIPFNLGDLVNGRSADIQLQREDQVKISATWDLKDRPSVEIGGEVRRIGVFPMAEGMTIQDLLFMAGGFTESGSAKQIEIARRIVDTSSDAFTSKSAEILHVDVDRNLNYSGGTFLLKPYDYVIVRNSPGYTAQTKIKIEGEVLHPGLYVLSDRNERISDVIKRAGGLTPLAYPPGATLKRGNDNSGTGKNKIDQSADEQAKVDNLARLQADTKDSTTVSPAQITLNNNSIGINLVQILKEPGKDDDLILKPEDILQIPQQLQTVKINGEVLYPVTALYKDGDNFKDYIAQAGGFTEEALRKHGYVVYANGSVDNTKHFLFFASYPKIRPGAEIFVPKKAEKKPGNSLEIITIATSLASLGAIILGILKL